MTGLIILAAIFIFMLIVSAKIDKKKSEKREELIRKIAFEESLKALNDYHFHLHSNDVEFIDLDDDK